MHKKKHISKDKCLKYNVAKTIKFRSPNLTLNHIIWQNNINLVIKLMLAVTKDFDIKKHEYRYNKEKDLTLLDKIYSDEKAFKLCDLIFDNDFDKYYFLR